MRCRDVRIAAARAAVAAFRQALPNDSKEWLPAPDRYSDDDLARVSSRLRRVRANAARRAAGRDFVPGIHPPPLRRSLGGEGSKSSTE